MFNHLYVDRGGIVQQDTNRGFFAPVARGFYTVFGGRDYRLKKIIEKGCEYTNDYYHTLKRYAIKHKFSEGEFQSLFLAETVAKRNFSKTHDKEFQQSFVDKVVANKKLQSHLQKYAKRMNRCPERVKIVNEILEKAKIQSTWVRLGLPKEVAISHYEDVKTLVESRLIYSIVGFQNTTQNGKANHEIRVHGNELHIKYEGHWAPVSELRNFFVWDKEEKMFANKQNKNERWNYFSPLGLVPVDRYYHHENKDDPNYPEVNKKLYPVEQLSEGEMKKVLAVAKEFRDQPHTEAVLQIIAHPRDIKKTKFLDNLNAEFPVHCGIRLIMPDGNVFSTGFGSTTFEDQWSNGLRTYFATINGQPTNLDYEEFRQHEGRITTNIPLTGEVATDILGCLNKYREDTLRFNILKQNCMRLGADVLEKAGVEVNIMTSVAQKIFRAIPGIYNFPGLGFTGRPIQKMKRTFRWIKEHLPEGVKKVAGFVMKLHIFLPKKFILFVLNSLIARFGGADGSPNAPRQNKEGLQDFDNIAEGVRRKFSDDTNQVFDSTKMIKWMLRQKSTVVTPYSGQPSMNIVAENDDRLKAELLRKFKVDV